MAVRMAGFVRSISALRVTTLVALRVVVSNPGRGVLHIAASVFGRSSLTPQGPLINLGKLFRLTGPTLHHEDGPIAGSLFAISGPGSMGYPSFGLPARSAQVVAPAHDRARPSITRRHNGGTIARNRQPT